VPDDFEVPEDELKLINEFIGRFAIISESSANNHLDIVLVMKALPQKVTEANVLSIEMYNFKIFQESLIAYQNLDMVNAFEYFDDKNRVRVQNVKEKLVTQKNELNEMKDLVQSIRTRIKKVKRESKESQKKDDVEMMLEEFR